MAEMDKHWLALAYGAVVSSGELQNSCYEAKNTTWLDSCKKILLLRNLLTCILLTAGKILTAGKTLQLTNSLTILHNPHTHASFAIIVSQRGKACPLALAIPLRSIFFLEISNNKFSKNTKVLQCIGQSFQIRRTASQSPKQPTAWQK